MGAFALMSSRDDSVEALDKLIEEIEDGHFVTSALLRIVKLNKDAETFDLMRGYYSKE